MGVDQVQKEGAVASRTITKRALLASGLSLLGGGLAAACLPELPGTQPRPGGGPIERATITHLFWETPGGYDRARARADDFETRHPGARIELTAFPYQEYLDKLQIMFASDTGPDTVHLDMPVVQQYAKLGVFTNLLPLLRADRELKLADFPPLLLEIMSGRKDNALVGLPSGAGPNLFYYNRALLDAAGRPTPHTLFKQDRWVWDAYLDLARAATRRSPAGDWEVAGCVPGLHRIWIAANGGAEFDDVRAPTKCLYDTPQAIEALTYLAELRTRYQVTPVNVVPALGANDINAFGQGKVALNARWTPPISQYRTQATFTWGLVPYPRGRGQAAKMAHDIGTSGTSVSKRTKAPNLTWTWAKFTVNEEGQLLEVKHSGGTGVPFSRAAQEATIQELRTIPTLETPEMTIEMMRRGHGVVRLLAVNQAEINAIINEELGKLWGGDNAAPVAARQIATRVNRYLADNPQ